MINFIEYGLDTDTSLDLVKPGFSDYYLNCDSITSQGCITNRKGNLLVTYDKFTEISGTKKVIGSCPDYENNCIYYFVAVEYVNPFPTYAPYGNSILRYDIKSNVIEPVLQDIMSDIFLTSVGGTFMYPATGNVLNFSSEHKINNASVINGLLYFNDNYNPPRKINIQRALNTMRFIHSNGVYGVIRANGDDVNYDPTTMYPTIEGNYLNNGNYIYDIHTALLFPDITTSWRKAPLTEFGEISFLTFSSEVVGLPTSVEINRLHVLLDTTDPTTSLGTIHKFNGNVWEQVGTLATLDWTAWVNGNDVPNRTMMDNGMSYIFGGVPPPANFYVPAINIEIYSQLDADMLLVIKKPPDKAPRVEYIDEDLGYNNIRGSMWQFAYRWKYDDNEYSVYSPLSSISMPSNEEAFDTSNNTLDYTTRLNRNNCIVVNYELGSDNVKKIEVIAKEGESGNWFLIEELDKSFGNYYNYDEFQTPFTNNEARVDVVQTEVNTQFDFVPQLAGEQGVVDNMLAYGDVLEGYYNTPIKATFSYLNVPANLDVTTRVLSTTAKCKQLKWWYFLSETWYNKTYRERQYWQIEMPQKSQVTVGQTLTVTTKHTSDPLPIVHAIVITLAMTSDANYPQLMAQACADAINTHYGYSGNECYVIYYPKASIKDVIKHPFTANTETYTRQDVEQDIGEFYSGSGNGDDKLFIKLIEKNFGERYYLLLQKNNRQITSWIATRKNSLWRNLDGGVTQEFESATVSLVESLTDTFKTWKTGGNIGCGIVYKDQFGRTQGVNKANSVHFDNYWFIETPTMSYFKELKYEISNPPPEWAHSYSIVATKDTSILEWMQMRPKDIVAYQGKILIDFNGAITDVLIGNPKSILSTWTFEKGDRLKIIAKWDGVETVCFNFTYDYEIEGLYTTGGITDGFLINFDNTSEITVTNLTTNPDYYVLEVYRPDRTTTEEVYYEIANYDIINPGASGVHSKGDDSLSGTLAVNQLIGTAPVSATGYIQGANAYLHFRETDFTNEYLMVCESANFSDNYLSDVHDYGKVYAYVPDAKQERFGSMFRYSQKIIPNTQTNGLSTFPYNYYDNLPTQYGKITAIRHVADTMKVLQEKRLTSYYLSRATIHSANLLGANLVASVTDILGERNISEEIYGCQHPESVHQQGRHLYFWDNVSGHFCRDSANGTFPISSYRMKTFFRTMAETIRELNFPEKSRCYTTYDEKRNQLIVSFIYEGTDGFIPQTLTFQEGNEGDFIGWRTFLPVYPESYGQIGDQVVSFYDGKLYLWDAGTRNNWHGLQYTMKFKVVGNNEPFNIKVWKSVSLDSNKATWTATVTTPVSAMFPLGQSSLIRSFKNKEGRMFAEFMKDINSKISGTTNYKLLNGNDIRGGRVEITMENADTDEVIVKDVLVNSFISKQ